MQENHVYVTQEVKSNKSRIIKITLLILGSILVFFGVGFGGYFIGKNQSNDNSNTPPPSLFTDDALVNTSPSVTQAVIATPSVIISPSTTPTISKKVTPTPTSVPKSAVITSQADMDGYMASNDTGSESVEIKIGRNKYLTTRGFVAFDTAKIPKNAKIVEAKLRIYQVRTTGDPYTKLGSLKTDHLNYGDVLDKSDYSIPAILNGFAVISKDKNGQWKEIDVTPQLLDDLSALRMYSQFRFHFETEDKGDTVEGDFAYFESADNTEGTGNVPQLVVKYN